MVLYFSPMHQSLRINKISLSEKPTLRLAHIGDIHYKGDKQALIGLITQIDQIHPDLVCFTGDLASSTRTATEALDLIANLSCPIYGVPGNHDLRFYMNLKNAPERFEATGGKWLINQTAELPGRGVFISGANGKSTSWIPQEVPGIHILLVHYPNFVYSLGNRKFDLILAGHSHGGQIRFPGIGAPFMPYGIGRYGLGLYKTPNGPLYVTSGVGTSVIPFRLNCPPEIALIEL